MIPIYTEADLVNFGNFILGGGKRDVSVIPLDGIQETALVSHADLCNWKDTNPIKSN